MTHRRCVAGSLECLCQHPDAACEKARSGNPRNHAAYRNHFLDQHEYRQRDDPQHIHHAADEQYGHQDPATAYAISAVAATQCERAERVMAKPAVMLNELQWRPALPQALRQARPSHRFLAAALPSFDRCAKISCDFRHSSRHRG